MRLSPPISVLTILAAAFVVMAGHAGLRDPTVSQSSEILEVNMSTWGHLEVRWAVDRNGKGEVWRPESDDKPRMRKIEKFKIQLKPDDLGYFLEQADELKKITRKSPRCEFTISDSMYGSAIWKSHDFYQKYEYNIGCNSVKADKAATYLGVTTSIVLSTLTDLSKPYAVTLVPLN